MTDHQVNSFNDFHNVIRNNHDKWHWWFYRGHSSPNYELVPKAGRSPFSGTDDQRMLEAWKRHAVPYLDPSLRPLKDWDYLECH